MLLTARPDQLPVDLKRQGRAEVHIPLFYPTDQQELRSMLMVLAKKAGTSLAEPDLPDDGAAPGQPVGRRHRGHHRPRVSHLAARRLAHDHEGTRSKRALAGFMPSTQTLEREAQELAAIIECTDVEFLPPTKQEKLDEVWRSREAAGATDRDQTDPRRAIRSEHGPHQLDRCRIATPTSTPTSRSSSTSRSRWPTA